ncbi:MAG: tRNA (N(6)-L-threonylcarbamoyladenosine(37)-C(2))-methylthiotransferase [archaeon]
MAKVYIETYGCTANQDNTLIFKGLLKDYKIVSNIKEADIIIVNTCTVKQATESKIIENLKKIIKEYPKKKIIIAGCMPEAEPKICRKLFPNASLINTYHVTDISKIIKSSLKNKRLELLGKRKENKTNLDKITKNKDTVSIQIAEGCLGDCTYCITKLAKGNLQSFPEEDIINEIKKRIKDGYKRINLTSTDNGCYGLDIKTSLVSLLCDAIKIPGDFKLRVGMINPNYAKLYLKDLIKIYRSDKIIKFLHIPVQSGSNKILKDMNRKYKVQDFMRVVNEFRKNIPEINISTDIIVGYPNETENDFEETLNLLKKIKPEILNISKFTSRPGTKASRLKQLKTEEIKRRSVMLTNLYKNYSNIKKS